jgi:hypothetical protein
MIKRILFIIIKDVLILILLLLSFNCKRERANPFDPESWYFWSTTFGGENYDCAYSVQQTSDGGYIIAGFTESHRVGSW